MITHTNICCIHHFEEHLNSWYSCTHLTPWLWLQLLSLLRRYIITMNHKLMKKLICKTVNSIMIITFDYKYTNRNFQYHTETPQSDIRYIIIYFIINCHHHYYHTLSLSSDPIIYFITSQPGINSLVYINFMIPTSKLFWGGIYFVKYLSIEKKNMCCVDRLFFYSWVYVKSRYLWHDVYYG